MRDRCVRVVLFLRTYRDSQCREELALARDLRTYDLPIGVYPRLGEVRLSGAVHTSQQKAAAEEIVRDFPRVRSVINDLVVDPRAELLPVMLPTGVEAEDKVPGKYIRHTIVAARDTTPLLMKRWCRQEEKGKQR